MAGDHGAGAEVGVLVGMQLDAETVGLRLVEQAVHLGMGEAYLVAEPVDLVDQALAHGLGQHLVAHEGDVVVAPAGELRREAMGAEIGRDHGNGELAAEPARHAHRTQLGLAVEARARLALDRGDAVGDQAAHAGAARGIERLLRQEPRALHQVADAAARRLEIPALTALAQHLEVDQPLLAVDDMGVGIDQPGRGDLAREVTDGGGRRRRCSRADPGDPAFVDANGALAHQPEGTIVGHGGDRGAGQEQVDHARR
jgi:hypothetical protein